MSPLIKTWLSVSVATLSLMTMLTSTAHAEEKRFALVIGYNNPPPGDTKLKRLHYADDDAVRYYQTALRWGADAILLTHLDAESERRYPEIPIRTRPPTLRNVRAAVAAIAAKADRARAAGDEPVFYLMFAGHGAVENGTPHLALTDAKLTQAMLYDEIVGAISAEQAHLIIDACHAGGVVGSRGLFDHETSAEPVSFGDRDGEHLSRLKRYPHVGVLLATTLGEEAHEWSHIESGVFSHEVLSGLSGAADINRDGRIEYSEIQAFVASANRELRDPRAAPRVIAIPPNADPHAPIARLTGQRDVAWLEGNPSELGHFYVEMQGGQRYLDAHLRSSVPYRIALPAGRRLFVRSGNKEATLRPKEGEVVRLASLKLKPRATGERGSIEADLHAALFAAAFTETYYQGYVDHARTPSVRFGESALRYDVTAPKDRDGASIALLSVAGATAATAIAASAVMWKAKRDNDDTTMQAASADARSRFKTGRAVAISAATVSVATGVAGLVRALKHKKAKERRFSVGVSAVKGDYAVALRGDF